MPLEPISRVVLTLFAAIIGFGLKKIIEENAIDTNYGVDNWIVFLITLSLSLRFFIDSAIHTSVQYVQNNPSPNIINFIYDMLVLITLGTLIAFMCYADSPKAYLKLSILFFGVAIAWWVIEWIFWSLAIGIFWIIINLAHLAVYAVVLLKVLQADDGIISVWYWYGILFASIVFLILDLYLQLKNSAGRIQNTKVQQ